MRTSPSRQPHPVIGYLVALVVLAGMLGGCSEAVPAAGEPVERVLVVSLPGVSWSDVQSHDLPALESFVQEAAIGDLSTRIGRRRASTTDAYLTIGAGTRAIAPSIDVAVALDPDELYAGVRTADILERRLGAVPEGIAYLAAGAAIDLNESSSFGAHPGRLGDLLDDAGVQRAVIANADAAEGFVSDEPPPDGAYARGAATALMGSDGIVPGGTVGRGLLEEDPLAPFGRRLDPQAVLDAFESEWQQPGASVVLVEASDLSRAAAYGGRSTPDQGGALRQEALEAADDLLEELLERTDPSSDAVLVVSPVSRGGSPELAIAALRAPGAEPGLLRSSTTRRDGYVQLADITPTILDLLGLPQPDEIEGRAFEVSPPGHEDRIDRLVDGARAAGFRDDLMPLVVPAIIAALAILALATFLAERLPGRIRSTLRPAALCALGVVPATFLAGQVPGVPGSTPAYVAVLIALSCIVGTMCTVVDRRRRGAGVLLALALIVGIIAGDVLFGAPLQVNAVFGYSLAVAGRFAGLGNLAFALFGAATVVLGALLADRYGRRGVLAAIALWTAVVLVEGLPMLGADVGGVVSMVPAFGAAALVLTGHRLRPRHGFALAAAAGAVVLVFAFVDIGRPAGSQTHLARLAEHVIDGRWSSFADSLSRRLQASFGGADLALWALVWSVIVVVAVYALLTATGRLGAGAPPRRLRTPFAAATVGLAVLAVVGLVANDSSIAVPATMLIVVVPVLALRHLDRAELEAP